MTAPVMRRLAPLCRVVVDNDFAGDPDGLVGLAQHLLSPNNRVTAITSSFLDPRFAESATTAAEGVVLAAELVDEVGLAVRPAVLAGAGVGSSTCRHVDMRSSRHLPSDIDTCPAVRTVGVRRAVVRVRVVAGRVAGWCG
jgi:hypothetical protein